MQGSDIASGGGTFSSEDGGIIKAYNNYMDNETIAGSNYRPWSSSNTVEFDAYEVNSAGEQVPSTVTAKKGGNVYDNNFITYSYTADDPQTARTKVMQYAGRYWRGDFSFAFTDADNSHSDDPMPALLAALNAYTSKLVGVQSGGSGGDNGNNGGNGDNGGNGEGGGNGGGNGGTPINGNVICSFGMTGSSGSTVFATNNAFTLTGANGTKPSGGKTINGVAYDVALKIESGTQINFTTSAAMTITLYTDKGSGSKIKVDGADITTVSDGTASVVLQAGPHTITKNASLNLWLIVLTP